MTKTKRGISSVLAAALLCSLCACSGGNSSSSKAESGRPAESSAAEVTTAEAPTEAKSGVDELLDGMSTEEKVGQMFYVCWPDANALSRIENYHPGGFVLFGVDFADKDADEIKSTIAAYQSASKIPMLIGVDEEGGTVVRVSDNPNLRDSAFMSPKDTYLSGGWEAVEAAESEKADLLLSLGVNVNNAPVADVTGNTESFMYDRSFSSDPETVSDYIRRTVAICKQKKLGTVLKHFPGYGDNTDTHEDMAYDAKPYEDFQNVDFVPFKAGIDSGADAVMVAHNIVASIDENMPASLSAEAHRVLRDELGFDGVIMTDELSMAAISNYTGDEAAAVTAIKCGNDLLCCSNVEAQYPAVLAAVQNGEISEEQIDAAVRRILLWKQKLGLI